MFRQAIQDALIALHTTGSVPAALIVAATPIALRALRR